MSIFRSTPVARPRHLTAGDLDRLGHDALSQVQSRLPGGELVKEPALYPRLILSWGDVSQPHLRLFTVLLERRNPDRNASCIQFILQLHSPTWSPDHEIATWQLGHRPEHGLSHLVAASVKQPPGRDWKPLSFSSLELDRETPRSEDGPDLIDHMMWTVQAQLEQRA